MSFIQSNLSVLAYANQFTLWHYIIDSATENADTVLENGYFNNASDMLRQVDRILIQTNNGTFDINVAEAPPAGVSVQWAANKTPENVPQSKAA